MNRRSMLIVAGITVLALGAAGTYLVVRQANQDRRREAVAVATGELDKVLSNAMTNVDISGPQGEWQATLDGDATKLTYTVSNRSKNLYKDIVLDGFALGKVEPREKATLPIKIPELAPGASHEVVLHYDGLKWLGDDVQVNRIDMGWAQKGLDLSESWVSVMDTKSLESGLRGTVKVADSNGSGKTTGIPVQLAEEDARSLKERRDAALKAKAAESKAKEQPPAKP